VKFPVFFPDDQGIAKGACEKGTPRADPNKSERSCIERFFDWRSIKLSSIRDNGIDK
jgi:hypothetical protein